MREKHAKLSINILLELHFIFYAGISDDEMQPFLSTGICSF